MISVSVRNTKNGKRYLRQAESSAIRFLIIAEAFKRMAASHVHTKLPVCIPKINCRSVRLRSAREPLSQFSRPFERGAVRFLFRWLFLHLRLRSDNVGSACAVPFAPFSGSFLKGAARFYPSGSRKPLSFLQQSLSASTQGVNRINRPLLIPSSGCHHLGCRSPGRLRRP
jgi:hypothetical protein